MSGEAPKFEKPHAPSPEEKRYDGESISGFTEGLIDDLTKQRLKELALLRESGKYSEEELSGMLKEIEADAVMIKREEEKAQAQVETLEANAMIDALTGLPNLRAFKERLNSEIDRAHRLKRQGTHEHVHLLFIDIDEFKSINDNLGHDIGDLYLKTAAAYIQRELRAGTDMLARKGGDEFVAILSGNDDESSLNVAERVAEAVRQASAAAKRECQKKGIELRGKQGNISASIGLASLQESDTPEALTKRADEAMYDAKKAGKNQVSVAEESAS